MLFSTNSSGFVIYVNLIPFQLMRWMDGVSLSWVCVLVHDQNYGSLICLIDCSSGNKPLFSHDMPVYSLNIDKTLRLVIDLDDAANTSSDSMVCTPINKSACHIQVSSGGNVIGSEVCHFQSIGNAFKVNICWSWRTPCFLCSIWDPIDTDITTGRYLISQ
jgi:hypothetical protein